jgi:hypothetical protein
VNFFGHAVVASWKRDSAAFALGAMLPDFAAMARGRLVEVRHREVSDGVAWHHVTDRVFHKSRDFRRLASEASQRLSQSGIRRGGARGAGHVAVELLLDGFLVKDQDGLARFSAALRAGHPGELGGALFWRTEEERDRWETLRNRLVREGAPLLYGDLAEVAERTARTLSARPLLALSPIEAARLHAELPALCAAVEQTAPALLAGLRRELALS